MDVRLQDVEDHRAKDTEEECNSYRAAGEEATRVMKAIKVGGAALLPSNALGNLDHFQPGNII